ncbi:MAG: universal stress protein [Oculatellaceae cyanobacterium Prado106]|jgi:nucleotide-binding universal stress UspA family protein|nr:universal stress protein [Oculatellaceae cyanobacterium Prado106]
MFKRILVALSNDGASNIVFDEAITLAKQLEASLMLVHVLPFDLLEPTLVPYTYPVITDETMQQFRHRWEEFEKAGLARLQALSEQAIAAGVTPEFTQNVGDPGRVICQVAKTWDADLIIMGRREQSALGKLIMGSTSQFVTRHSDCAVLLIPDGDEPKA